MANKSGIAHTFATIDRDYILKGDKIALTGYFMAAEECIALCKGQSQTYVKALVADGLLDQDAFNTTRAYIGAIIRIKTGKVTKKDGSTFKMADFNCITDLRDTVSAAGSSGKKAPVTPATLADKAVKLATTNKATKAQIRQMVKALEALL